MTKFLNISTDNTLGGSSASNEVVSSQKAVKDYVDSQTGTAPAFANITGSPTDNTALANALNDKYDASNPSGFTSNIGTVTSVNNTGPDSAGNVSLTIPSINSSNNYVPYRSGASAFSNSTLMYNSSAMAFTGKLHVGSTSPGSYSNFGRFTIYDNTPSQQVTSMALLNYGGGGGCGVAIDMYNTSANGGIPSGRFGLIDNGNYSGYLQLQVKKSGAQSNPLLPAMNIVPVPASNSLTTCVSFGQDEFNRVLFDLHKPEASCTITDSDKRWSGSETTYQVVGTNKFNPRLLVAVGDIVSFDNFSTEATVTGVVSNSSTCQITTNVSLGTVSYKNISVKKAYFKITDESNNIKVYVNPYGKFGIGTGTPSSDLDVNGTINASTDVKVNGSSVALVSQIPTVNDATLTIQKNGTTIDTFTANSSTNKTINVTVPTQPSDIGAATSAQGALADTALQSSDVVNNTTSTATDEPLSANMGKSLQDQIDNLNGRGRYLALWNCATGLAQSNPPQSPYTYKAGDYFIVGTVASGSGTNYKPSGSSYTTGVASTTVETEAVAVNDVYYYDGTSWSLQINTQKEIPFSSIAGDPYDNTNLASALNGKVPTTRTVNNKALSSNISLTASDVGAVATNTSITGATKCKITYDSKGLVTAGTDLSSSDITTALGYTPYDSSNPNGYTSNVGTVTSVNNVSPVSGNVTLSIPTVNNSTITITQGGVTKGSFTLNQSSGDTIELDAGSGGGAVDSVNGKTGVVVLDYSDVGALPDTTVIPTVDQIYSSTSSNAQSGTAVASAVSGKQATITGAATTITSSNLTTNRALISNASGKVAVSSVTSTELGYVSGVTSAIQTQLNNKQATISDLSTIRSGASAGATALQPNTTITGATKCKITYDSKGLVTGGADLSSSDITTALGFTPYNSTNPSGYQANVIETIKVNGTAQTVTSKAVDITVPTNNNQLTNGAGYITGITSSDVTTALGYTPYSSSNPNGYTSNVGTVTSVNNVSPVNGNVTLSIPSEVTETTVSGWGFTKNTGTVTSVNNVSPVSGNVTLSIPTDTGDLTNNAGFITSSALSGYATETWVGQQGYLQNTATGTGSLNILGTVTSNANSVSVGVSSNSGPSAVAVGYDSRADNGVAIGKSAKSTGNYSIQLGSGTNSEDQSFYVSTHPDHNWKLLGSLGKIPNERLSILSYVVEYYDDADGYWYRLWSDDWLEQGFIGSPSGASPTFTFPKPFYDADYNLVLGASTLNQYWSAKTSTGFKFNSNAAAAKSWYACGWAG